LFFTPGVYQPSTDDHVPHQTPNTSCSASSFPNLIPPKRVKQPCRSRTFDWVRDRRPLVSNAGTTNSSRTPLDRSATRGALPRPRGHPKISCRTPSSHRRDIAGRGPPTACPSPTRIHPGDDIWPGPPDHGTRARSGWTSITAAHGLVRQREPTVAGARPVSSEHYQELWTCSETGNGGEDIFLQNENCLTTRRTSGPAWNNGSSRGYAAYDVPPNVTSHQAYGMGSYWLLQRPTRGVADRAFERRPGSGASLPNEPASPVPLRGRRDRARHPPPTAGDSHPTRTPGYVPAVPDP